MKSTAIASTATEEQLAFMREQFPAEESSFTRISVPRITFVSQDKTEEVKNAKTGKKEIKVIVEGGTFFFERQVKDKDGELVLDSATGKPTWEKEEVGSTLEGIIIYQRKQLKMYDEATEKYTNSAIYDKEDEIIPIWCEGKEVGRGTPAELKAKYEYTGKDGKKKSALEDNRILYVMVDGDIYQLSLRSSSMYSYLGYVKTCRPSVPAFLTLFSSEHREKGDISWEMMVFKAERPITKAEGSKIVEEVTNIKEALANRQEHFAAVAAAGA